MNNSLVEAHTRTSTMLSIVGSDPVRSRCRTELELAKNGGTEEEMAIGRETPQLLLQCVYEERAKVPEMDSLELWEEETKCD